jgi:hypothetical protein
MGERSVQRDGSAGFDHHLPIALVVDAEPDGVIGLSHEPWVGLELAFAEIGAARGEFLERTGTMLRVNWMLRADQQIADVWGDPAWALERFSAEIDDAVDAGDFVGLHVHPLREEHGTEDYLDVPWTLDSLAVGLDAFERRFDRPPRVVSWGRGWTSDAVVRMLGERGVGVDMSVAPERDRSLQAGAIELLADVPDLTKVPRQPYYPSVDDWRTEAAEPGDRTWILPYTSSQVGSWLHPARRAIRRLRGGGPRNRIEHDYLWATVDTRFGQYVHRLTERDFPYLTLSVRSSRFLAASPGDLFARLASVERACRPVGGFFTDPVSIVDRFRQDPG